MPIRDVFEPRHEPARSIYLAFQKEATKRAAKTVEEWTRAEIEVVHAEAAAQATRHKMRAPTITEIERAERYARGSVDYGLKWAL